MRLYSIFQETEKLKKNRYLLNFITLLSLHSIPLKNITVCFVLLLFFFYQPKYVRKSSKTFYFSKIYLLHKSHISILFDWNVILLRTVLCYKLYYICIHFFMCWNMYSACISVDTFIWRGTSGYNFFFELNTFLVLNNVKCLRKQYY